MIASSGLIATIALGLVAAFVGGFIAVRLRLPAIVGYLLAGVAVGPFTPGFVANAEIAHGLAEVGVILLMFGVGIHFSLRDLFAVRAIALPGAIVQIAVATALGTVLAMQWGWDYGSGIVLGLAIAVASTVVLLRALAERDLLMSIHGRVAVGWLVIEDIFTVLVLVLLPALAPALGSTAASHTAEHPALALAIALAKVAVLGALMLFVGARIIPWVLVHVSRTGSRELFTLGVLAVALGVAATAAAVFGVSLALGAFLAGVVVSESDLSYQAAADALPLRDAFAVLFFVSVGMLFDPSILLAAPGQLFAILLVIVLGKAFAAVAIVALLGYPIRTGLTVAAGLAQIGEFSFILAELGRSLRLLSDVGHNLILAAALISITLNPLAFRAIDVLERWIRRRPRLAVLLERRATSVVDATEDRSTARLKGHAVVCGYGRVGRLVAHALELRGFRYAVIDQNRQRVEALRRRGATALYGDAANPALLEHVDVSGARVVVVAIADPPVVRYIVEYVRGVNPRATIVARTHSEGEYAYLSERGVDHVVFGERELAAEMVRYTLQRFGVIGPELQAIVQGLRRRGLMS